MSDRVGNWDEFRTAFQVARAGTVSGAAAVLGVHHATVIRHIDMLEQRLGVRLFHRHARGYTMTEAGQDLMQVAGATDDQLSHLVGRLSGQGGAISGELVVTTVSGLAGLLAPLLGKFRAANPDLLIRYITDNRLFRLEYGEAHLAIRAGKRPQEPDNVVQPFVHLPMQLCASRGYLRVHGTPKDDAELLAHEFVGSSEENAGSPFARWMANNLPAEKIAFRTNENDAAYHAIRAGVGIGFLPQWRLALEPDLVGLLGPREDWAAPLWLVTHVDLHRSNKVQAIVQFLKDEAKSWGA